MMKKNVFVLLFVITIIIGIATPAFAERLKYTGLARSEGGAVLASATVAVYLAGTTTPADVYEASSSATYNVICQNTQGTATSANSEITITTDAAKAITAGSGSLSITQGSGSLSVTILP